MSKSKQRKQSAFSEGRKTAINHKSEFGNPHLTLKLKNKLNPFKSKLSTVWNAGFMEGMNK